MKRMILSLLLFFSWVHMGVTTPVLAADAASVGESACQSISDAGQKSNCIGCFDGGSVWTAAGCLGGSSPSDFVASFIRLGTGLGGGIAMLLILVSGFQRITSAGNPDKLHEAKELMTAAISGLLLIIFSVYILKFIGVEIFGTLPGFGGGKGSL